MRDHRPLSNRQRQGNKGVGKEKKEKVDGTANRLRRRTGMGMAVREKVRGARMSLLICYCRSWRLLAVAGSKRRAHRRQQTSPLCW